MPPPSASHCVWSRRSKSEVIIELLEQRFAAVAPEKTAYETPCETGFIASLSATNDLAGKPRQRRHCPHALARINLLHVDTDPLVAPASQRDHAHGRCTEFLKAYSSRLLALGRC